MNAAVLATIRKEFRQISRDRRMIGVLIGAPTFQLFVLGYAVNLDVDRVETVVCDHDHTAESRAVARELFADGTFLPVSDDCTDPVADIRDGRARAAVVFPKGLARDLASGRTAEIQVLVDGTNPVIGKYATNAAAAAIDTLSADRLKARLETLQALQGRPITPPILQVEPRVLYNPRMESALYMVPGVSAMLLLVVTTITTAMGLAREREMGTMEQVLVTPIRPYELLLGKVIPAVLIGLFDVLLALVVGAWAFGVPIRGSVALLYLGALVYLMSTVGLGMFVSTISRTQQQAIMGGFFLMMPAILLSGVMTPIENMPHWLQPLTWINPVRYCVEILRGILLKGAGFEDLWRSFLALFGYGLLILAFASARFRKRLA